MTAKRHAAAGVTAHLDSREDSMRHQITITVNGQMRDEVALAPDRPLDGVVELALQFDRTSAGSGFRCLRTTADDTDYSAGAYRFRHWHWWPQEEAGIYRARAVTATYADGNSISIPLNDDIVVDVQPLDPTSLPGFSAR
jgi:hypothetical protein